MELSGIHPTMSDYFGKELRAPTMCYWLFHRETASCIQIQQTQYILVYVHICSSITVIKLVGISAVIPFFYVSIYLSQAWLHGMKYTL